MKIIGIFVVLVAILTLPVIAEYSNVGAIMQFGVGARAVGLGGAFLPLADDATAAFYNPAGLGWINHISVTSYFSRQFDTLTYGAVGITLPYIGAVMMRLDSGLIPAAGGGFNYVSQCGVVGGGIAIGPVGIGARVKVVTIQSPYTAVGWAVDPALLIVTDVMRVGIVVKNAYSQPIILPDATSEDWPLRVDAGVALRMRIGDEVTWDASFTADDLLTPTMAIAGGAEIWVGGLGIRAGWNTSGLSLGLSVQFSSMRIGFVYTEHAHLGGIYGASVTFTF